MQSGQIKRVGKCWLLRYWESVKTKSGNVVRRRKAVKLATYSDSTDKHRREEIGCPYLAPRTRRRPALNPRTRLIHYLEHVFLPSVKATKKPSTYKSYSQMVGLALPHWAKSSSAIFTRRKRKPCSTPRWVIRRAPTQRHRNLQGRAQRRVSIAKQKGAVVISDARHFAPRGLSAGDTHAYTLDEIHAMLAVYRTSRTLVLVAALTGLGAAELKGLLLEDFTATNL